MVFFKYPYSLFIFERIDQAKPQNFGLFKTENFVNLF